MSECTCTSPAGQPHEPRCPAIDEAWEKAFAAICKTPAAIPPDVASLAKECFAAGYTFASDPEWLNDPSTVVTIVLMDLGSY